MGSVLVLFLILKPVIYQEPFSVGIISLKVHNVIELGFRNTPEIHDIKEGSVVTW